MALRLTCLFASLLLIGASNTSAQSGTGTCGDEGVWIQTLGAGGPELNDDFASSSYLVWSDNKARALIDLGAGAATAYDLTDASFQDLDVILLTHLEVDHATDLAAFAEGSLFLDRDRPLPLFGPDGNDSFPATTAFAQRLIGAGGAFPYLSGVLEPNRQTGYHLRVRDVPASGSRPWARFRNERLSLSAIPVHHGDVPAIAWRLRLGGKDIVFTGDFSNQKDRMASFAKGADAIVFTHAIPEGTRGTLRDLYVTPDQIGRIAARAETRMVLLGHRMNRTRGRESLTRETIEKHYQGYLLFVNDLECWGL